MAEMVGQGVGVGEDMRFGWDGAVAGGGVGVGLGAGVRMQMWMEDPTP